MTSIPQGQLCTKCGRAFRDHDQFGCARFETTPQSVSVATGMSSRKKLALTGAAVLAVLVAGSVMSDDDPTTDDNTVATVRVGQAASLGGLRVTATAFNCTPLEQTQTCGAELVFTNGSDSSATAPDTAHLVAGEKASEATWSPRGGRIVAPGNSVTHVVTFPMFKELTPDYIRIYEHDSMAHVLINVKPRAAPS